MKQWNYILVDGVPGPEPDIYKWGAFMSDRQARIVAKTPVGPGEVSTVFLGTDHRFGDDGPPVLYETMIFGVPGFEDYQRRYETREQALEGHAEALAEVQQAATAN